MTNFEDFEIVLEAANEEIKNLQRMTQEVKESIDEINQKRYRKVLTYFCKLAKITEKSGMRGYKTYIPTPIEVIGLKNNCNYVITVESYRIGIYHTDSNYNFDARYHEKLFLGWVHLKNTYKDTVSKTTDTSVFGYANKQVLAFLEEIVDNFDEYEPEISNNYKEIITSYTADKVLNAKQELANAKITLAFK